MAKVAPLKSIYSQMLQYPERKLRFKFLRKGSYLKKVAAPRLNLARSNEYNYSSNKMAILFQMDNCNYYCEIGNR